MLRRTLGICMALGLFVGTALPAMGASLQVGNCTTATPQYPSITIAVNNSSSGDTINVCPGSYAEQVFIGQNLTLQGIELSDGTFGQARIVSPPSWISGVSFGGFPIDAQVYVYAGATLTMSNITIDGANNNITTCATDLVGVLFQNASGSLEQTVVKNQLLPTGYQGCQSGEAVRVESAGGNSNVTVDSSLITGFQKNGISGKYTGTTLTVSNNAIVGVGPTTGAAENGVEFYGGAKGSVTSNRVADTVWVDPVNNPPAYCASGILVYGSKGITISGNRIANTQCAIAVITDPSVGSGNATAITGNLIDATHAFDAIDACSNNNNIANNIIQGADQSAIHLDSTCGGTGKGNTVSGNTVNLACAGILEGGTPNTIATSNKLNNVLNQLVLSDTCTVQALSASRIRQASHARPIPSVR